MPQRLPRFYARLQLIEDERKIGEILREGGEVESESGIPIRGSADGHHPSRLRGLPAIGRNVSGAISGSDPVPELIRRENGRRRRERQYGSPR